MNGALLNNESDEIIYLLNTACSASSRGATGLWTPIEYRVVDVNVKNLKLTEQEFTKESVRELYTNKLDSKIYKEVEKLRVEGIKSICICSFSRRHYKIKR
jgi:hypothetical protein